MLSHDFGKFSLDIKVVVGSKIKLRIVESEHFGYLRNIEKQCKGVYVIILFPLALARTKETMLLNLFKIKIR
jgi:hypothetical protein